METYMKMIKEQRKAGESVIETLYRCNLENGGVDEAAIDQEFDKLDEILDRLTLKEYDTVWDATCVLCDAHERRGFRSGVQTGALLMLELLETEQGKDSCFSQKETAF